MLIQPLAFQTAGPLSVLQFATSDQDSFAYVPADIAIGKGMVEVRETSDAGSVNALIVLNASDTFIFLMDGDILAGAKQNRVLNTSVLLAPHSKTVIPVSCVEQGRWHAVSPNFTFTDYTAPSHLRKTKSENVSSSLNESKQFDANQGEVWNAVRSYSESRKVESPTMSFSDVYEAKRRETEQAVAAVTIDPHANGVMFFLEKKILHADHFTAREVFAHYLPKLLKGVAMEYYGIEPSHDPLTQAQAAYDGVEFLDGWAAVKKDQHPAAGLGTEQRAVNEHYAGMQLAYNEHIIHCSVFSAPAMGK